ncbi:MAG: ATP-binding protein [Halobacteriales archaeon]|nr:ATP-binding protein [Halobacteriales archaeon]
MKTKIPRKLDRPSKFFGQFTVRDIIRLGVPSLGEYLVANSSAQTTICLLSVTLFGALTGVALYAVRPYGHTLDSLVYNAVRWTAERGTVEGSDVENVEDEYIRTETGELVGVLKVEPVRLESRTDAEKVAVQEIFEDTLDTLTYPIEIHSEQRRFDLSEYTEKIDETSKQPERLRDSYTEYCGDLSDGGLVRTDHYIVIRVGRDTTKELRNLLIEYLPVEGREPDDIEEVSKSEVESRCHEVLDALNAGDLSAERVTGKELDGFAQSTNISQPEHTPTWCTQPSKEREYITVGEYRKAVYVEEFPQSMELGWTRQLLRCDGLVDVTQVIEPKNPSTAVRKLQRIKERLDAEIDSFIKSGNVGSTNDPEARLEDTNWFLDLLAERTDKPYRHGVYITAHDKDRENCLRTLQRVENRLETMRIDYRKPVFRTDKALRSISPYHADLLNQKLLMPTRSVATGLPFATQGTNKDSGVVYGIDSDDEMPVLLDRFSWDSYAVARVGMTGSGKSFSTKLELIRSHLYYDNLRIVVVDPKQEYAHVVRTLDGEMQKIEKDKEYSLSNEVTGFTVKDRGEEENVELLVDVVRQLYRETSQDDKKTLVVVDEAHNLMNHEEGRQVLSQWIREARDTKTAITLISQNVGDFTNYREGKAVLSNTKAKIFHRHDQVEDHVVDYFNLSQREEAQLRKLKTGTESEYGEGIVKITGKLNSLVRIEASTEEKAVIEAGA